MAIGEVVAGKYRVERLIGEGGMAVVVAATHLQLDTLVALKLLPDSSAADPVLVEHFLREARAAARLRSEHVCKVLDVGTLESGAPFMVMEYLEGANLSEVLSKRGRLDPTTACDYVVQACEAVAEAHALGIVHRDLKPENLYLTTRVGGAGIVKVLDFGISKTTTALAGALTTTSAVVGSPVYMAPEQMRSARVADPRSDVWALGVVLYELMTERCPFEAESLPELCLKITRDAHPPLAEMRKGVPPKLAAIVERCLQKDPARRYENAAELASVLEPFAPAQTSADASSARRALQSLGETMAERATDPGPGEQAASTRRRRRPASLGALVVCAAVVAVVWIATRPASGPPGFAMAAVDGVRSASSYAQEPEPAAATEMLAPLPAATAAPAASDPARPVGPQPRSMMMMRTPRSPSSPLPRQDDDIPAYR
ncbi:MAG TPA: serine/threonine-protein kinase [Polyangiaceae bacterium]